MHGENPPTPLVMDVPKQSLKDADEVASRVKEILNRSKLALDQAKGRAKQYADMNRRELSFAKDDLVLLSTRNLKLKVKHDTKLLPKFIGPLRIKEKVGTVAYRLELPPRWRIHDVFHVSLLRKYVTRGNKGYVAAPPVSWLEDEPIYEVEAVLDHKDVKSGKKVIRRFLIKWAGFDHSHNSWEREGISPEVR